MKRREFISLLGGAAAVWPLSARAQQARLPIIGYLNAQAPAAVETARNKTAFQQGLREAGYIEGQNVLIEYRWAEGRYERLPALAAELTGRSVAVIAATGSDFSVRAAKAATTTIPIIFSTASDPVQSGFVASLNRPSGNVTGVTSLGVEVAPKRLQLLREVVPAANIFALLVNPINTNAETISRQTQAAAQTLGVQLHVVHASTEREIETALASLRASALVIGSDGFFTTRIEQLGAQLLRHAVPSIYAGREYAVAGGLMSYGEDFRDMYRHIGVYAGRILRGEKPADLPVLQATKVELIINMKTAKALGLTVPITLLGRADEVIE